MKRWDGKLTSILAAQVHKLKEETTNKGNLARMNLAPVSSGVLLGRTEVKMICLTPLK